MVVVGRDEVVGTTFGWLVVVAPPTVVEVVEPDGPVFPPSGCVEPERVVRLAERWLCPDDLDPTRPMAATAMRAATKPSAATRRADCPGRCPRAAMESSTDEPHRESRCRRAT